MKLVGCLLLFLFAGIEGIGYDKCTEKYTEFPLGHDYIFYGKIECPVGQEIGNGYVHLKEYDPVTVSDTITTSVATGGYFELGVNRFYRDQPTDELELYLHFENMCDGNPMGYTCGSLTNGSHMIYRIESGKVYTKPYDN